MPYIAQIVVDVTGFISDFCSRNMQNLAELEITVAIEIMSVIKTEMYTHNLRSKTSIWNSSR